ncbi:hypothetical protein AB0J55_16180 [Amycolatopsis sp. NPDC049688]|uniref:hypothetical protein n=1 Tax=Amycolatopsis sp. NPDC049688 TaxID=3154733 RepID=UPI00341818DE
MGIEVVLGALIAWAASKARRAGKALDGVTDEVVDGLAVKARTKILELVLGKVGDTPAVKALEAEVATGGEVSELTRTKVELAVTAAERDDTQFAQALQAAVAEALSHGGTVAMPGGTVITGTASTSGSGDAFGAVGAVYKGQAPDPQQPDRA